MKNSEPSYQRCLTPPQEVERRVRALQARLKDTTLDGLLLLHPVHIYYFSGTLQDGYLWIPCEGLPVLWVIRNRERAEAEASLVEILPKERLMKMDQRIPGGEGVRVGLEMDVLPVKAFRRIRKMLPERSFEDAAQLIQRIRQVKSPYELEWMREAGRLHAQVFQEIPSWIHEGESEIELSARIEYELRLRGHQGLVRVHRWNMDLFYGPVVSGESGCVPSCFDGPVGAQGLFPAVPQGAGRKKIRRREPILIDQVFGYNGYFVDKSRTFFLGQPSNEHRDLYALCERIQEAVVSRLKPGTPCASIYKEVMGTFEDASPYDSSFMGCRENRVGFLGHGVGLELDEWPVLAPRFREPLQAGMTIAVEPKFFPPGLGGIGLENTFLVGDQGPEKLTDFSDDLVVID